MTVKFDKEMLLKHRFWILVGVTTVLSMLGIVYLQIYGSEETEKQKKKWQGDYQRIKNVKCDKGPVTVGEMAKKAAVAKAREVEIWRAAFTQQEPYFRWSDEVEKNFNFLDGKFAREVKISKKPADVKQWPADTQTVEHGELIESTEDYLRMKNRKGEVVKVYAMGKTGATAEGQTKTVAFIDIARTPHGDNPLLAVAYQRGMYFNDPLTGSEKQVFKDSYAKQLHDVLKSVEPLDDKGNGVVQLKNWLYDKEDLFDGDDWTHKFIRVARQPWVLNKDDISTEAWIAQEDLWIQKEIYRIIRSANDDVATFKWDGGDQKKQPDELKGAIAEKRDNIYRFKNTGFAIELTLQKDDKLKFTIRNLLPRKQKLDLNFRVFLNSEKGRAPEIIRLSDLPLMPANDPGKKDTLTTEYPVAKDAAPRKGIYGVQQVLTWETAAIKRIDHLSIGSNAADDIGHSHRTFADDLRPYVVGIEGGAPVPVIQEKPKKGKGSKGPPKVLPGGEFVIPSGPGGVNRSILAHGLWTDRYVEISEQSRRIPIAVALIIDQEHVDGVLTAFNNSKLRFLETQVLLNLYTGSLQPPVVTAEKKEADPAPGGRIRPGRIGFGVPAPNPATAASADSESNMEIVIYGIMTLYERYPPRPAAVPEKK